MSQSQKMQKAINQLVIPNLISQGFIGEYPHYKKIYPDRIELLVFQNNNWGNSFTVEISTIFLSERNRDSNFISGDFKKAEDATVWDTNLRYRLKGMYDGWFYYTNLYSQKIGSMKVYNAIGETKATQYVPSENEVLVQKATDDIYLKVCREVNLQMKKAFKWWDAFNKNSKVRMMLLEKF